VAAEPASARVSATKSRELKQPMPPALSPLQTTSAASARLFEAIRSLMTAATTWWPAKYTPSRVGGEDAVCCPMCRSPVQYLTNT
jgi:hypothetical protein